MTGWGWPGASGSPFCRRAKNLDLAGWENVGKMDEKMVNNGFSRVFWPWLWCPLFSDFLGPILLMELIWGLATLFRVHGVETARSSSSRNGASCNASRWRSLPPFFWITWLVQHVQPSLRGSKTGKHGPLELRHGNRRWDFFFGGFAPCPSVCDGIFWGKTPNGGSRHREELDLWISSWAFLVISLVSLVLEAPCVGFRFCHFRCKISWMAMSHDQYISKQKIICRWCLRRSSAGCDCDLPRVCQSNVAPAVPATVPVPTKESFVGPLEFHQRGVSYQIVKGFLQV